MTQKKKRVPAEERKIQILKSAVTVFARSNYRTARMSDIASEVGISEAMIYKYFPSKKVIYLKILQFMSDRIISFWQQEFDKNDDAWAVLKTISVAYYNRMILHPEELKVHFQAFSEVDDEDVAGCLREGHIKYIDFIKRIIEKGIEQSGSESEFKPEVLALIYDGGGIAVNMMKLLSINDKLAEKDIEKIVDTFISLIKG
ncbi:MAG: TetR/AcrR family transcriptional regulator [Desulfobacterales bacterium]|nr:TetR/AcrR family transcriptional regulator [Desulfobacterales bacterium]MCP4164067.1 TetR/AcrR family transcriptional regulator [Deltaproteobacteria bacterium]